jgi:hypothetical protein
VNEITFEARVGSGARAGPRRYCPVCQGFEERQPAELG